MRTNSPPVWRKSSRSLVNNCVEVADAGSRIGVRDSKEPGGPVLIFGADAWRRWLDAAKAGGFDLR